MEYGYFIEFLALLGGATVGLVMVILVGGLAIVLVAMAAIYIFSRTLGLILIAFDVIREWMKRKPTTTQEGE